MENILPTSLDKFDQIHAKLQMHQYIIFPQINAQLHIRMYHYCIKGKNYQQLNI